MTDWLNQCHFGDVRGVLARMIKDGVKVQTIVTSPPYWGLRSYLPAGHPDKAREIGSEPTLREFLETMVGVFNLCREVLADDGTMWVNMGDSYAGSCGAHLRGGPPSDKSTLKGNGHVGGGPKLSNLSKVQVQAAPKGTRTGSVRDEGMKSKDLMGQPWRLTFALQDAGWWLRQDIIWAKPNPMLESTRDRCTKAHEYIFLLSKSPSYYCDMAAIRERVAPSTVARLAQNVESQQGSDRVQGKTNGTMKAVGGARSKRDSFKRSESKRAEVIPGQSVGTHRPDRDESEWDIDWRNKRSVWTVPTESYSGAHFAVFPRALIEPCILAGAPAGGIVLDIFMGSGTTAQVAEKLGRQWIGIDIDVRNKALQDERLRQPSLELHAA